MADPKSHYSKAIQPQQPPSSVTGKHRILMTAPNFLRLLSILFSAASVAVMVTSNQTVIAAMYSNVPFISNAIMKATGSEIFLILTNPVRVASRSLPCFASSSYLKGIGSVSDTRHPI
ncbi:hypothetical protein AHAS_Ahas19G0174900 [Arachis hypogaea]